MHLFDLPTELLTQVVRYASLNGDLPNFRISSSRLLEVSSCQPSQLFEDLSFQYGIGTRTSGVYLSHRHRGPSVHCMLQPSIFDVLVLGSFLHKTQSLGTDVDRALSRTAQKSASPSQLSSREPFVLFASFTRMLTSSSKVSHSTTSDVLVPAPDGRQTFSKSFSDEFVHFLKEELTLEELEAIIAAISVCVTRLWSAVFMFRPKDSTVVGFSSLSGTSFSTDQAILTEHVIWRGPLWVSRILDQYGPGERVATQIGDEIEVEEILVKEGLWKGSREEGARLAANGVARLLWKERQERIETKANASAGKVNITDIRVNPSVWRGSSGDM